MSDANQPTRPSIPPIPGLRPTTPAEAARLKALAERGRQAEEVAQSLPPAAKQPDQRPVIDLDEGDNANWLRLLAQRKHQQQHKDKETPDHG